MTVASSDLRCLRIEFYCRPARYKGYVSLLAGDDGVSSEECRNRGSVGDDAGVPDNTGGIHALLYTGGTCMLN